MPKIQRINSVQAIGIAGVNAAVPEQELHIGFNLGDNETLVVKLPAGAVGGLAMSLEKEYAKVAIPETASTFVGQPQIISGAQAFSFDDGRVGLVLALGSFEIPILFSPSDVENLRASLVELEFLAKNPKKPIRQ